MAPLQFVSSSMKSTIYWNTSFPFSRTKKKNFLDGVEFHGILPIYGTNYSVAKGIPFDAIIIHYIHRQESIVQSLIREKTEDRWKLLHLFLFFFFSSYWLHCAIHIMQFRRFCSGIFGNYARHELLRLCSEQSAWRRVSCTSTYTTDRFLEAVPAWLIARSTRTHRHLLIRKYLYSYKKHGTHGIREQLFFCQDR